MWGDSMPCPPGTVLGGVYRILDELGRGGNGTVYLARHERAGRLWAVKEIPKSGNRLIMEAEFLKRLHHPGLPAVGDILEEGEMLYLVMDYIEGRSLKQILAEEGVQDQKTAIGWGCQLCGILTYLHEQDPPVIYRDMKPSNIMLREDGTIILVDFGTARERKEEAAGDTVCLGTRGYAAPEQYGGYGQTGPETDIYGLGAVLYHLLTGHSPAEPPYGIRPVRSLCPELSGGLEKILLICTRNDPKERYHSCRELLKALEHYEELDDSFIRQRKRRRMRRAAVILFVAFAGISLGVWKYKKKQALSDTYEAYMTEAAGSVEKARKEELLKKAVMVIPEREEAYEQLLQCFLEDDGEFSREEEVFFREVLEQKERGGRSCLEKLSGNRNAYIQVAYEAGLMYFYYYEGEEGKGASARWLSLAAEAQPGKELPEYAVRRAGILSKVSRYYDLLDLQRRTGDAAVSYGEYWEDLLSLSDGEIEEEDNRVTALAAYREIILQIALHGDQFKRDGVEQEEMRAQINRILGKLEVWEGIEDGKVMEYEKILFNEVKEGILLAEEAVETVYQDRN